MERIRLGREKRRDGTVEKEEKRRDGTVEKEKKRIQLEKKGEFSWKGKEKERKGKGKEK